MEVVEVVEVEVVEVVEVWRRWRWWRGGAVGGGKRIGGVRALLQRRRLCDFFLGPSARAVVLDPAAQPLDYLALAPVLRRRQLGATLLQVGLKRAIGAWLVRNGEVGHFRQALELHHSPSSASKRRGLSSRAQQVALSKRAGFWGGG